MSDNVPVSDTFRKALASRRRMLEAMPEGAYRPAPVELASDAGCDGWFAMADRAYSDAADAYLSGDVPSGNLAHVLAQVYTYLGQICAATTWGVPILPPDVS
jgi:hypothetical protein